MDPVPLRIKFDGKNFTVTCNGLRFTSPSLSFALDSLNQALLQDFRMDEAKMIQDIYAQVKTPKPQSEFIKLNIHPTNQPILIRRKDILSVQQNETFKKELQCYVNTTTIHQVHVTNSLAEIESQLNS